MFFYLLANDLYIPSMALTASSVKFSKVTSSTPEIILNSNCKLKTICPNLLPGIKDLTPAPRAAFLPLS